jgi:DNA repair protein RadD
MTFELRPYQKLAVEKLLWSREMEGADICVLPTGAGKSLVIADLAHKLAQPILIIQPTKEILEQNVEKMRAYVDDADIGIYSASMGRKDISTYTFATIQSIYKKPEYFSHFKYIIIDECHLVNPKNLDGMFTTFLAAIGNPKVVGLTATPYRMDVVYEQLNGYFIAHTCTKLINRTKGRFWHRIVCCVNLGDLVDAGYLLPLKYIDKSIIEHEDIPTNISLSDFSMPGFERAISTKWDKIVEAIYFAQEISKHVLVFCSSIEQATMLQQEFDGSAIVTSETSRKAREGLILAFREGRVQTVFNVGVLTTGFDFPELDGIVLIRPTKSIGLYYQMAGRGVRKVEGKKSCKIIDLSGTVKRLGRIETIKMVKREMWELESETCSNWHNRTLYSYKVDKR